MDIDEDDLEGLCYAILLNYLSEDHMSQNYCIFCRERYGNINKMYRDRGIEEPHHKDCPVLIAKRLMENRRL